MRAVWGAGLWVLLVAACATKPPPRPPTALAPVAVAPSRHDPDICGIVRCRPATLIRLADPAGTVSFKAPARPYIHPDGITVLPGDDFFVTGQVRDGVLEHLRYVDPPADPHDVIHIRFVQERLASGTLIMSLRIESYFDRPVVYQALGRQPGTPDKPPFPAGTGPLRPGVDVREVWPGVIAALKLNDFRFSENTEVAASD